MNAMEILLLIDNESKYLYYDVIDFGITNRNVNEKEINKVLKLKKKEEIQLEDLKCNILLPLFEEINHKDIMSFYVKHFVEDKEVRKQLFYILRRNVFVKPFVDKVKELGLYKQFEDTCYSLYHQIFTEWSEKHSIKL